MVIVDIISKDRKDFVSGRHLLDGVTIIHDHGVTIIPDQIHSINICQNKGFLLKLDMLKPFNRVN